MTDQHERIKQAVWRAKQPHASGQFYSLELTARELACEVERLQAENKLMKESIGFCSGPCRVETGQESPDANIDKRSNRG